VRASRREQRGSVPVAVGVDQIESLLERRCPHRAEDCPKISSARSTDADGSFSPGLSITVLPQAIAMGANHSGTMAGKLNGVLNSPL
jgi:hypothetical protein